LIYTLGKYTWSNSSNPVREYFGSSKPSPCSIGDTIGCGIALNGAAVWTKNGNMLEFASYTLDPEFMKVVKPTISLMAPLDTARINFGTVPFKMNLSVIMSCIKS